MKKSLVVLSASAAIVAGVGRVVNAIPAVVAAAPGVLTTLDLPLITGPGLAAAKPAAAT